MQPVQRLSVHAVTDQFQAYVPEFLASLEAQDFREFQLTLVDNASPDSAKAAAEMRDVTLLRNLKRQPWGKAHNQALALAFSRWGDADLAQRFICIATARTVVAPESFRQLMEVLDRDPELALACPKVLASRVVLAEDGERQEFEFGNRLIAAGGLMSRGRRPLWRGAGEPDGAEWASASEVFFPHPSLFIVRASWLKQASVNGAIFDESLAPLPSVIDLVWRLKLLGGRSVCVERAISWVQPDPADRRHRRSELEAAREAAARNDAPLVRLRHAPWVFAESLRLMALGGFPWPALARWRERSRRLRASSVPPSAMVQWFI